MKVGGKIEGAFDGKGNGGARPQKKNHGENGATNRAQYLFFHDGPLKDDVRVRQYHLSAASYFMLNSPDADNKKAPSNRGFQGGGKKPQPFRRRNQSSAPPKPSNT